MKEHSDQWVIKIQTDQVKGPYSTDAVIKMILNGVFSGSEEICSYPEGEWQVLTKQPEFYDALLESLENPVEVDQKRTQKMEAETVIRATEPLAPDDLPKPDTPEATQGPQIQNADDLKAFVEGALAKTDDKKRDELKKNQALAVAATQPPSLIPALAQNNINAVESFIADRDKNLEIQMTDLQKLKNKEIKKLLPFIAVVVLVLGALIYFAWPDSGDVRSGWVLSAPKRNAENTISADELRDLKRQAVRAFQGGIMEQILAAQAPLIRAVEGAPKDLESIGLLCMVYEQTWPYTKQTPEDLKSVLTVTQMARNINPVSNYSDTCQSIYLMVKGQGKEARSLIEHVLDNPVEEKFSLGPFLYLVKAELLEGESNFVNAEAYYNQAAQLWPQWQTARFGLARMLFKEEKFSDSREAYETMYNADKNSKAALFGLGLVESKGLKDNEKAVTYFANGFSLKQQLPKDFATEALGTYAQILIDKNDPKSALTVAQQAYHISPSNRALHEMVLSLGGDDKVENAQSETMLIGDQFARAGDHMVAQAQYKAAFDMDPRNAMAAYKAAKSLWQINQTRDAIHWLEKSIQADPKFIQAYILKADYESQKYNFSEAAKTLQLATRRFSQSHEVIKAQALMEFRKNNMLGAIQYGERAVKIYNADVELLSMLSQAYIYYYLNAPSVGKDALKKKDDAKEKAQQYAARAADLEPAWPEAQITRAKALAAFEGAVRGETYLKEFIKAYPYTIEYRIALAEFYVYYEKYDEATSLYEEIVKIDPKNKKANFGLAECYRILNKPEQAQKYYNATSMLDPSDVEPMFANAKLLIENAGGNEYRAKIEQALSKLELVRKINPDFPKVSYMIAKCYLELNNYDKALEYVKEEKLKNPNIADSYILTAEIYYRKSQFKECAAEYSKAIKMRPNKAELYVRASMCYRGSDALDIAQDMIDIAFSKESGYAENFREQGYIAERLGQKAKAVGCWKRYLNYSPNAVDRKTVEAKINQLGEGLNDVCRQLKESY